MKNKFAIVLALTSNKGSADFQKQLLAGKENLPFEYLYEKVLKTAIKYGTEDNLMFVAGATQAKDFEHIRTIIPNHFLLVPGIGFQGGSLEEVSKYGMNKNVGLLVNVSRAIIYASGEEQFAFDAALLAKEYQQQMEKYLGTFFIKKLPV